MKKMKRLMDLLPAMLLWAVLCAFFWGKVFMGLTDTAPEYKITVFVDAQVPVATEMAVALEERESNVIQMVKVHPFSYAMMGSQEIETADLYIISAANMETYKDWFLPLPEELTAAGVTMGVDGVPYGLLVYDGENGAAKTYIAYAEEKYYLCLGKNAVHLTDLEAVYTAQYLLTLP